MGHFLRPSLPTRSTLSPPVPSRPPNLVLSFSAALPREVIMLAIATAALIVFSMTAEAAFMKYDYGGREIYKHEDDSYEPSYEYKRGDDYPEPSHKSHYADQYHGHKPSYEIQDYSLRPHHDSYDEDHYGRYAYSVEPSYSHYRHRRAADKKDDEDGEDKKDEDDDDDEEEKKRLKLAQRRGSIWRSLSLLSLKNSTMTAAMTMMKMTTMTTKRSPRCLSLTPTSRIGSTGSLKSPGHIGASVTRSRRL